MGENPIVATSDGVCSPERDNKEDKRTFRTQQLWLEAAVPLVSLLETAHEDKLDPKTAVTMVQSALLLIGMPRSTSRQTGGKSF